MVRGARSMPSYSMTRRRRASVQRSTVRCRKRGLPTNAFGENGLRIGEARLPFPDSARTRRWKRRRAGTDRKSTRLNPVTNAHLVCRLLLEKKKQVRKNNNTEA